MREWIKWVKEKSGRLEICELSETDGREVEKGEGEKLI